MTATHNIKINGRWYTIGEQLPEEKKAAKKEPVQEKPAVVAEEPKEKPKTAARRKSTASK